MCLFLVIFRSHVPSCFITKRDQNCKYIILIYFVDDVLIRSGGCIGVSQNRWIPKTMGFNTKMILFRSFRRYLHCRKPPLTCLPHVWLPMHFNERKATWLRTRRVRPRNFFLHSKKTLRGVWSSNHSTLGYFRDILGTCLVRISPLGAWLPQISRSCAD